jgi:hypothetical protein
VENHKDCKEVAVLGNITKNVKTSTMFNETEHLIKEMQSIPSSDFLVTCQDDC